jgi:hypothetical protein
MMLVKVEAREFRLKQTIEELEETKAKLEEYSQVLERKMSNQVKNETGNAGIKK